MKNIERWFEKEAQKGPGFCEERINPTEFNPGNFTRDFSEEELKDHVRKRLDNGETVIIEDLAILYACGDLAIVLDPEHGGLILRAWSEDLMTREA